MKKEKTYFTIAFRYTTDSNDPCNPPPHFEERLAMAMSVLHEKGYAMDVIYGKATDKTFIKLDKEMHEDE